MNREEIGNEHDSQKVRSRWNEDKYDVNSGLRGRSDLLALTVRRLGQFQVRRRGTCFFDQLVDQLAEVALGRYGQAEMAKAVDLDGKFRI